MNFLDVVFCLSQRQDQYLLDASLKMRRLSVSKDNNEMFICQAYLHFTFLIFCQVRI